MMSARLFPVLLVSLLASTSAACAASSDEGGTAGDESNLDTSGCTGNEADITRGAVSVHAERPPTSRCWNIQTGGMSVKYSWAQTNDATPQKKDLGFYVALNGAGKFMKAGSMTCEPASGLSMGADTSGTRTYACSAVAFVAWKDNAEMVKAGYDGAGRRIGWDVAVAVALDNDNHWDSLNGANYHFPL